MNPVKKIYNAFKGKKAKRNVIITFGVVLSAAFFIIALEPAYAVRISLKRIVFDGSKRSEILTIINNTPKPKTYRLGWKKYRMDEGKALKTIEEGEDDSGILWADKMVRFAPRRVTIPPGGAQQVRLLLRRPKDIQEAEYRAHLWIIAEVEPEKYEADPSKKNQSIRLSVQPAISLPIFVRHGELNVEASITNTKLTKTDKGMNVAFTLNRTGNRSVYGDFEFVCKDQGEELVLHQVRGIAVYTEANYRNLDFDIPTQASKPSCSNMKILYRADPNDKTFAGATLAEASATLQ